MLRDKTQQGWALIGGVIAVVVGAFVIRARSDTGPKPGDDNCVGTPTVSTVVLIDHSEVVSQQTLREIQARALSFVLDSVSENERVSVFSVNELSKHSLVPIVSICRPRQRGNRMTESVKLIQKRFDESFRKPLDTALAVVPGGGLESPVAQAITDLTLTHYLGAKRNRLLVFSDMLEHTSEFSLYTCRNRESVIAAYRASKQGAQERPQFRNTVVRLNVIPRLDQHPEVLRCRDRLWAWFFGDNSGPDAGLETHMLPGGPAGTLRK